MVETRWRNILEHYYLPGSRAYDLLLSHGKRVAEKALFFADNVSHLNPDGEFIEEAAMLHDIGIFFTDSPELGCYGKHPYIQHGVLGRNLLEKHNLHRHALVCERHVGVGLTVEDIRQQRLPLPERDMTPKSLEEELICFADKFFSKRLPSGHEWSVQDIVDQLAKYDGKYAKIFLNWTQKYDSNSI